MQVTQQVFVAEECIRSAHNKFEAESNFRRDVEKVLRSKKLKTSEHERQSTLVRPKTVEAQAEDQHKLLFTTKLNPAMEKATVLSLKVELEKAKAEAQGVKEAA